MENALRAVGVMFIKNGGTYFLTDLKVYADGMIDCWGLVDFTTFRQKVASGWVATTFSQGAEASAHHLAQWRFDEPQPWVTAQQLIAEVADEIEHLAGRPTSEERCLAALDRYLDDPSAEHLAALRNAYLAVPEHLRLTCLAIRMRRTSLCASCSLPSETRLRWDELAQAGGGCGRPTTRLHGTTSAVGETRNDKCRSLRHPGRTIPSRLLPLSSATIWTGASTPIWRMTIQPLLPLTGSIFSTVEHAYWALATSDLDMRE